MRKKTNYLVIPNTCNLKKESNVFFLFPLEGYCVGFDVTFNIESINIPDSYIYINRMLDTVSIDNLKSILNNLPEYIKGIVFEDLGVYELIKDKNVEKILYQTHSLCGIDTINTYLNFMDSVVISPDITKEETITILNNSKKEVVVYLYGHLPYMYSRRLLNTFYENNFNLELKNKLELEETVSSRPFFTYENEYGTVIYDKYIYNAKCLLNESNVKYFLINLAHTNKSLDEVLTSVTSDNIPDFDGFLNKKTIYRLKEIRGESNE